MEHGKQPNKKAIVLANFGTTHPSAVQALTHTQSVVQKTFPEIPVQICFTSNMVRNIWKKRQENKKGWLDQGVSKEIMGAKSFLGVIGELQNAGFRTIIVQPTYIAHGEQFEDLRSYVHGLQSIQTIKKRWMPFEQIVLSRPTLGTHGIEYNYRDDVAEVVSSLVADVELARRYQADIVYVGHGNEYFSAGIYSETQKEFRKQYPDIKTFIGVVEGYPLLEDLMGPLQQEAKKKLILKPFMVTAGEHAHSDLAGETGSWKTDLSDAGFEVISILEGLGSNPEFAQLYAKRIQQTAHEHGIDLTSQNE
ncbi:sirohydrochlorin cobaltochelatase [Deltaproteobacteria bacterium TL4]